MLRMIVLLDKIRVSLKAEGGNLQNQEYLVQVQKLQWEQEVQNQRLNCLEELKHEEEVY